MEYKTTFAVPLADSVVDQRIADCLAHAGFVAVAGQPEHFKRGSLLSSSLSFSPLKVPTTVAVITTPEGPDCTEVSLTYDVNTKGQLVGERDLAAWQADLEGLQQSILTGEYASRESDRKAAQAARTTLRGLLIWFGVWLVVGLGIAIGGVLLTGKTSFATIGIVVGCFVGYLALQRYSKTRVG